MRKQTQRFFEVLSADGIRLRNFMNKIESEIKLNDNLNDLGKIHHTNNTLHGVLILVKKMIQDGESAFRKETWRIESKDAK